MRRFAKQLDGNIIGPKILGNRTGLSSFWVLFAIVLFGGLWGVPGMVICVPVFAVIYNTIKRLVRRGLHKKGQSQKTAFTAVHYFVNAAGGFKKA